MKYTETKHSFVAHTCCYTIKYWDTYNYSTHTHIEVMKYATCTTAWQKKTNTVHMQKVARPAYLLVDQQNT